jgi:hypothetical protein
MSIDSARPSSSSRLRSTCSNRANASLMRSSWIWVLTFSRLAADLWRSTIAFSRFLASVSFS